MNTQQLTVKKPVSKKTAMSRLRQHPTTQARGIALVFAMIFSLMIPANAAAYGEDCGALDFECWYDAAVEYYTEVVIPAKDALIADLRGKISTLKGQLTAPVEIAENLADTITGADLGFLGLDEDAMDRYTAALEFIHDHNDRLLNAFEYFAADKDCDNSPVCSDFRSRLAGLFFKITELTNQANGVVAVQHQLDGQLPLPQLRLNSEGVANFIAEAPPALLFPLYYLLDTVESPQAQQVVQQASLVVSANSSGCSEGYCTFFESMENMLDDTSDNLDDILDLMQKVQESIATYGMPRDPLCTVLFLDSAVPDELAKYASYTALGAEIIAEFGSWLAKPKLSLLPEEAEGGFAFGAGAKVTYDVKLGKRFGLRMRMLATPLRIIGQGITGRVSDCRQRLEQYLLICSMANDIKKNATFKECKAQVLFTGEKFGF